MWELCFAIGMAQHLQASFCGGTHFSYALPALSSWALVLLQDLYQRIDRFRPTPPLEGSRFHYGFNSKYLKKVLSYWRNEFDWRKQVEILNKYPHFKTKIEGVFSELAGRSMGSLRHEGAAAGVWGAVGRCNFAGMHRQCPQALDILFLSDFLVSQTGQK